MLLAVVALPSCVQVHLSTGYSVSAGTSKERFRDSEPFRSHYVSFSKDLYLTKTIGEREERETAQWLTISPDVSYTFGDDDYKLWSTGFTISW